MIEFSIYWPELRNSDRKPHNSGLWIDWEKNLLEISGGFSLGQSSGKWRDADGHIVADNSRVYRVALPYGRDAALYDLVRHYRPLFDQNCVYVAISSENAMIVE